MHRPVKVPPVYFGPLPPIPNTLVYILLSIFWLWLAKQAKPHQPSEMESHSGPHAKNRASSLCLFLALPICLCLRLRLTQCHCSVPVTTVCPSVRLSVCPFDWLDDGLSIPLGRAHAFADAWPKTKVGNGGENSKNGKKECATLKKNYSLSKNKI